MNRNGSQLVLHDVPIFLWLFGLIFAGFGAVIFFEQGGRAPAMGLVFIAIGLGILLFTSVLTITADGITRTLKLEYHSVLRHIIKEIPFDEIVGINVERSVSHTKGSFNFVYQVVLKRKDGQEIAFRSYASSGSRGKQRKVSRLRDFIGVQGFDNTPAGMFSQSYLAQIHETDGVHWQIQLTIDGSRRPRWYSPDFKTPGVFLFLAQKAEGQASQGFLASLGSMFFKQALSLYGFHAGDTPNLDKATLLAPLDPALEPHFMAFTSAPAAVGQILNSRAVMPLADWAGRYPVKQFRKGSRFGQLVILFGPDGVYLATMNPPKPDQVNELAALGAKLVKSQGFRVHSAF